MYRAKTFLLLACLLGWIAEVAHAQFVPFGGGGGQFGGGNTGARRTGTGGSATREYPNNTQVGDATISYDPETRTIVVVTDEQTNVEIGQLIKGLDQPKPQVLIKVVFVEATFNDSLDFGIEGGYRNSNLSGMSTGIFANVFGSSGLNSAASNLTYNALGQNVGNLLPTPPGAGLYQVLGRDYQATLRAIATAGKAEILSRPSILARNSQPATISLGQQVPLVTNTRYDTLGNQINTVSYQNVGIILQVTPFITSDGLVEMILAPQTSELADRSQWVPISSGAGGSISAPVINSRSADTVVVVPDGQTVIIGGLMQKSKTSSDSKIPVLGDIPLLGNLFKRKQKTGGRTELMIFLTPHIVQAPSQLAGLTAQERAKSTLNGKTISEEDLNRFLDTLPVKAEEPAEGSKSKSKRK